MPLGPILPGRLPNSLQFSQLSSQIAESNRQLTLLQQQSATGRRIFRPSDDPAAAIRAIFLQASIEQTTQLRSNVDRAASQLQLAETALAGVNDGLNRARAIAVEGTGDSVSDQQRAALADELASIIDGIVNDANQQFNGRHLFGGSVSDVPPIERLSNGTIRYNGDERSLSTYIDANFQLDLNVHGHEAFNTFVKPNSADVDPALTTGTRLTDLHGGIGVPLGTIRVTVDDGTNPAQTADVDLSGARSIGDVKTLVENAFAAGPATVTVDVDPATNFGIRIQQSGGLAGTVTVEDLPGSLVASKLGIAGTGATINGSDLDPRLTKHTNLADLNAGTGIGTTTGNGLQIVSGPNTVTVDISSATTVEDLFNLLEATGLDIETGFNDAGNGIVVSSRRSGEHLSIGENNGSNATLLGIRTLTGSTPLAELNYGVGVPNQERDTAGNLIIAPLDIQRRDGTSTTVDLKGLNTIQEVLDAITAVDANLTATLNTVGNGITITDTSGTGDLVIASTPLSDSLGISGSENGPIVGSDTNPQESAGVFDVLLKLEAALRSDDRPAMIRLVPQLDNVIETFTAVRGEIGSRLRTLDDFESHLLSEDLFLQEQLSEEIDADLAEVVTRVSALQGSLQATLQIAGVINSLSILNFI